MALGFYPLFLQREVIVVTDFEMLSLVIMMIMLVISVLGITKGNKQSNGRHPALTG